MRKNRKLLASLCISAVTIGVVNGGEIFDGDSASYSPHNSVSTSYFVSSAPKGVNDSTKKSGNFLNKFDYVNKGKKQSKSLLGKDLEVSGTVRFLTIQRTMQKSYEDMTTSDMTISFTDYPTSDANSGAIAGFPLLELNL